MTCVYCCRTKASAKNLTLTFHSFPKDNEMSDVGSANCDVYFQEFPEDLNLREQWINACKKNGFDVKCVYQQHRICSY
ncbi:hypothetical protein CBL_13495 [Carabus blaptoides fortunei]